ncbi:MAG: amidohydrolase family protein [Thioalkalispiraceae bacterium]|jgi:predicted TIM-barrel fold metal-dependent hydrolase
MLIKKFNIAGLFLLFVLIPWTVSATQDEQADSRLAIFDAHIHYSHDVWEAISPTDAIRRLRAVGVKRALVSSSSDEGTQRLYRADPEFVVPVLRPYRKRGTIDSWMYDDSVIPYLKQRLANYRYAGIGELHIDAEQAYTPVMQEIIRLAKKYDLFLHVHSDAQAIKFIFEQYPEARILWAHAGFEYAYTVRELMDKQRHLWADLSFRSEIFQNGRIMPAWQPLLVEHADRFLLGIDTYEPQRWLQLNNVMQWQRGLLAALPAEVARKIAAENGERITKFYDKKVNID